METDESAQGVPISMENREDNTRMSKPSSYPVHLGIKNFVSSIQEFRAEVGTEGHFLYARSNNRTVKDLEESLARAHELEACMVTSSGMSAMTTTLLSELKAHDHVIMFAESYQTSRKLLINVLRKFAIESTIVSMHDKNALAAAVQANTKAIIFETISNPLCHLPPFDQIKAIASERGILTICDNTAHGLKNPTAFVADYTIHSLSKHVSGHSDALGGAVLGEQAKLVKLAGTRSIVGSNLDPHSAFLISRGLKTYDVRQAEINRRMSSLVKWLQAQKSVQRVFHSSLRSSTPNDAKIMNESPFLTFSLVGGKISLERFADSLRLVNIGIGWGGTETVIMPLDHINPLNHTNTAPLSGADDSYCRLAIGMEPLDHILDDIGRGLSLI